MYTCMIYDKSKNINHTNDHNMSYKCKALDINSIQYHLIYIRITHHSNMHFDLEKYMIIITSCIKNMKTCSTLSILYDISSSSAFSHVSTCLSLVSEKIGNITHDNCKFEKYMYNSTQKEIYDTYRNSYTQFL